MIPHYEDKRLFIAKLPPNVTENDLSNYFEGFGKIVEIHIPRSGNRVKRFAFVTFSSLDESRHVVQSGPHYLLGKQIAIDYAEQKKQRPHEGMRRGPPPSPRQRGPSPRVRNQMSPSRPHHPIFYQPEIHEECTSDELPFPNPYDPYMGEEGSQFIGNYVTSIYNSDFSRIPREMLEQELRSSGPYYEDRSNSRRPHFRDHYRDRRRERSFQPY